MRDNEILDYRVTFKTNEYYNQTISSFNLHLSITVVKCHIANRWRSTNNSSIIREGLTQKKSVKFHTWGVGQDKIGSFSLFFLSCPKSCKSAKKIFLVWGEGTPYLKSIFLDILGKNHVIFYQFSRFISVKKDSFYENMLELICEKKNSY